MILRDDDGVVVEAKNENNNKVISNIALIVKKKRISFLRLNIMVHLKNKISSIAPGKYPEKQ